ncbi:hypothetical protein E0765_08530 [Sulfuricurvum sp. IAE1]|uniref:hypothetical protein n=1 Tax=Sulfuricurvum sp. IAE1 TaxID=2546102 RepID=UPI00104D8EAE|nr:hypothetical protein [Sulfuricurvum sp. IAE1]TDA63239.1 hypothetical protein E0765_08530 [Sulfuricurvum sp. IAE1]
MAKRYDKTLGYDERVQYVIKGYETAIIRNYDLGLSEEMKLFLAEFVQSVEQKILYYETARMIYYRQPLPWIRWTVNRRLKQSLNATCLEDVIPHIQAHVIAEATAKVMRGGFNSAPCLSEIHSDRRRKLMNPVKRRVKFLEFLQETFGQIINVKFIHQISYFWGCLINKEPRRKR